MVDPAFFLSKLVAKFTPFKSNRMEQLLANIHNAEQKHLYELYSYIAKVFSGTNLPSHDARHHLRVWLHCRELIIELYKAGIDIPETLITNAIVACFFHDSGLAIDIGEIHGKLGGQICREYYSNRATQKDINLDEIIEAIEFHDDKSVKSGPVYTPMSMKNLTRLVSTADDLDALGVIGVFRYIEIYLKRNIPDKELPKKVLKNLKNRFTSFTNAYSSLQKFSDKQRIRYLEIINFFSELDLQVILGGQNPDGQLAVYNIIKEHLIEKKQGIDETVQAAIKTSTASYPLCFFSKLRGELNITSALIPG